MICRDRIQLGGMRLEDVKPALLQLSFVRRVSWIRMYPRLRI
jgi:hypothetical protein